MPRQTASIAPQKRQPRDGTRVQAPQREAAGKPAVGVRSLERALDLLEALERLRAPAGVRALEGITRIPKATAQRLLDVLERRGLHPEGPRTILPRCGVVTLARGFLQRTALPPLRCPCSSNSPRCPGRPADSTSDKDSIGSWSSEWRVLTHCGTIPPSASDCRYTLAHRGMSSAPECRTTCFTSTWTLGPVRLASGEEIGKRELLARILQVRHQGYVIRFDERFARIGFVAAPVVGGGKEVIAAINIAGPSSRLSVGRMNQLAPEVSRAAGGSRRSSRSCNGRSS